VYLVSLLHTRFCSITMGLFQEFIFFNFIFHLLLFAFECLLINFIRQSPPPVALRPNADHDLLILRFLDYTQRRITVGRTSLDERSARRRDLYLTTHNTQTNTHAPGWIRTHDLSRRVAVDLRLRQRGHWDRPKTDEYVSYIAYGVAQKRHSH